MNGNKIKNLVSIFLLSAFSFSAFAAGNAFGFTAGIKPSVTDGEYKTLEEAGITYKRETVPLYFSAMCAFDLADALEPDSVNVSIAYHIADPVFSGTALHWYYGPIFNAGVYGSYYTDIGLVLGLSYFTNWNTEVFAQATAQAGLNYSSSSPAFQYSFPVNAGIRFYF